jgi:hypothetical protein
MLRKSIMLAVALLMLTIPVWATDIFLAWSPMPADQHWISVRVYERVGSVDTKIGESSVPDNTFTVKDVSPGVHVYFVRSYDGTWESDNSNTVSTGGVPLSPQGLSIRVVITIAPESGINSGGNPK